MEYHFVSLPSLFFTSMTLFIFLVLIKIKKRTKLNLPPGPLKLPLIGNLHNLIGSLPHRGLWQLAEKYGPVMHLQLGELSTVVVSAPETAKIVMKTNDVIFAQRPRILAIHTMTYQSKDIGFSHGNYWRQLRKICTTELMSGQRVRSFRSMREEEVEKLIKSISTKTTRAGSSPFNLSKEIFSLTYGVTGRAAFGEKCKQQEEFIACMQVGVQLATGFGLPDMFPSVKLLHVISGIGPKMEELHRRVDKILNNIINQHRASRPEEEDDMVLVDVLLNLQERGDLEFPLEDENIKAVILGIFVGGSETSSTTVEWTMSEMIKNPRVMEKAQAEVRRVYDNTKGTVDEGSLPELKFLKCVIKETMRLHPSIPLLFPRECQQDCKINGYDVPAKTRVLVNAWAIGRDPSYWDDPDRFYPERFLDSAVDFKGTNFEFIPFGAGRRICPGMSFAMPNVELPLANFLYHFDWKVGGGIKNEDLDMAEGFGASVRRQKDLCLIAVPYSP